MLDQISNRTRLGQTPYSRSLFTHYSGVPWYHNACTEIFEIEDDAFNKEVKASCWYYTYY